MLQQADESKREQCSYNFVWSPTYTEQRQNFITCPMKGMDITGDAFCSYIVDGELCGQSVHVRCSEANHCGTDEFPFACFRHVRTLILSSCTLYPYFPSYISLTLRPPPLTFRCKRVRFIRLF